MSHSPEPTENPNEGDGAAVKRPFWRNPYVIAAIAGMISVHLIRPCTRRIPDPPPVIGQLPAFSLTNQEGVAFGSRELKGKVYVTTFFFTGCVTICPRIMQANRTLQERFKRANVDVHLVSITVDPENDSPEKLKEYASKLGIDFSTWTFLSGDREKLRALIVDGFKTYMGERERNADDIMDIGHGSRFVLVDGQGGVRGNYGTGPMGIDEVFHRAQHVLNEAR